MKWFKIEFNDVFFNGLSNAEIGLLVKYRCLCQQKEIDSLTWEQICFNFDNKERKILSKLVGIEPKDSPKLTSSLPEVSPELVQSLPEVSTEFTPSLPEVNPKLVGSLPEVSPELVQSLPEVCLKSLSENNNLACARIYNNTNNISIIKTDKTEERERVKKSASRTPNNLSLEDVVSWDTLFDFWEQNKKGGKYANAGSRNRMLAKLKELTSEDFEYAKQAIIYAIDNKYQGFTDGSKLYYRGDPPKQSNDGGWDAYWVDMEAKLEAKRRGKDEYGNCSH